MLLALALGAPAAAVAQEQPEPAERERAQRRVQEAQRELERALQMLREEEMQATQEALQEAMEAVRAAQRQLRAELFRGQRGMYRDLERARVFVGPGPEPNVVVSWGRPRMGVILETDRWRSDTDSIGAVIQAVTPGGPADEAGIEAGDIIVEANGQALGRTARREDAPGEKLVAAIRELEEGETLSVTYRRGDETRTAEVVVRPLEPSVYSFGLDLDSNVLIVEPPEVGVRVPEPARIRMRYAEPVFEAFLPFGWLSMELVTLDEELGAYFGTDEGLLVIRAPSSDVIDLKAGDVILSIDGREPESPSHALRIMRSYEPGESMTLSIMRNRQRATVEVMVPERDRGFFWRSPEEHEDQEEQSRRR
jgi:membrane-associated protease RseP (regulator of RpoE activity)